MSGYGEKIEITVYLDGHEVPAGQVTWGWGIGNNIIFSVDLPPVREVLDLKPRTMVHVTYRDYNHPNVDEGIDPPEVVILEGEYVGYDYEKTPTSRKFILRGKDISSYFSQAKLLMLSNNQVYTEEQVLIAGLSSPGDNEGKGGLDPTHIDALTGGISSTILYSKMPSNGLYPGESYPQKLLQLIGIRGDKEPLNTLFYNLIHKFTTANYFFKERNKIVALDRKYHVKDIDPKVLSRLMSFYTLSKILTSELGKQFGLYVTLQNLFTELSRLIRYEMVPVPAATTITQGEMASILFKNEMMYYPPPKCNVFFGSRTGFISYSRNFMQEITRYGGTSNKSPGWVYRAPPSFYNKEKAWVEEQREKFAAKKDFGSDIGTIVEEFTDKQKELEGINYPWQGQPLSHERHTGPLFFKGSCFEPTSLEASSGREFSSSARILIEKANHEYFKQRYRSRSTTIVVDFNPYVVAGFPGIFIDENGVYTLGYVVSVKNSIDPAGRAQTIVSMAYCRQYSFDDAEKIWKMDEPGYPPWATDADLDIHEVNDYYLKVLGCTSIVDSPAYKKGDDIPELTPYEVERLEGDPWTAKSLAKPVQEPTRENTSVPNTLGIDRNKDESKGQTKTIKDNPYPPNPFAADIMRAVNNLYNVYIEKSEGEAQKFAAQYRIRSIATKMEVLGGGEVGIWREDKVIPGTSNMGQGPVITGVAALTTAAEHLTEDTRVQSKEEYREDKKFESLDTHREGYGLVTGLTDVFGRTLEEEWAIMANDERHIAVQNLYEKLTGDGAFTG